ncbi:aminopeptidase P family protein [Rothia sp. ZJ1223]|uniref:aminopeptidase P family protein n=1 Tax=Rothia sp. ZJ1223 TaxID=2811098 RepID=UPI001959DBFE|nr:aminopeptidase P family protein [Rothia sp. ZJ1223]MBM7051090.1 aminopeptidase P family protein [Rothia sp. ZJ1223]
MTENSTDQNIEERVKNRSQPPTSQAFKDFMASKWAEPSGDMPARDEVADYAAARRAKLSARFVGERLVIPAGPLKVRSNDTDYRFRPHSAFAHLTGLGTDHEPDAVLVMEPVDEGTGDNGSAHEATLYFTPLAGRDSEKFYADPRYGEFWIGARPTLAEVQTQYGINTADLAEIEVAVTKNAGNQALGGIRIRLVRDVDMNMDALVDTSRYNTGVDLEQSDQLDAQLTEALSEIRLIKDAVEVENMRRSVNATIAGFENIVKTIPTATGHRRGERLVEGAFFAQARAEGNDLGYDTIAACGNNATVLHWIRNNGTVDEGKLILVDAGVEDDTLYTADITRTLPVDGKFTEIQAKVYQAVLDAADAAFQVAVPGNKFKDVHAAAMKVLANRLEEWGLLPVSAEVSLSEVGGQHRRWMPHGTSHHLGLDVHDCAQAKRELYIEGVIEPGMVFTIEPGLYFKEEDLAIPEEYRGIGVRIEDDVLITEDGNENLSAALPRDIEGIEQWMADILKTN